MKTIWLVGASEGIGRALAIELAKEKNNSLILSARNKERLGELAQDLEKKPLLIEMDVGNKESIAKAWSEIQKESFSIDTIIYCAGYYKPMSAESMELDEIEKND
jgi:short-subunit dehydrogenase